MTPLLRRLRRLILAGLARTRDLWPAIERAYRWVHAVARVLGNADGSAAPRVERRFTGLIAALARHRAKAGALAGAVDRFLKVTHSYRPGLFHAYRVPGLPRSYRAPTTTWGACSAGIRHHDRRATGRKTASPTLVPRGSVRLVVAATATRLRPVGARELARADRTGWTDLRHRLDDRRHARVLRTRFRRGPDAYLSQLERLLLQPTLPS